MTDARASTAWIMLLTLAGAATTLVFACATPFPALAAHGAAARIGGDAARLAGALIAATVAFKGVVLLWSLGMEGHAGAAFAPAVLASQFARNAAVLAGLVALRHLLTRAGLPPLRGAAA